MHLDYVPQYRDDAEAASARFPGDAPDPRAPGAPAPPRLVGGACVALVACTAALLLYPRGFVRSAVWRALVQADRIDDPVFVTGVVLVAIGGAMVVVPLVYLLGLRRSARPVAGRRVRVELGDDGLAVRFPGKELSVTWAGVVAVAETRHLFVLKTVGDLRLALPKRAAPGFADAPAASDDTLRQLLRSRIPPMAAVAAGPHLPTLPPRLAA